MKQKLLEDFVTMEQMKERKLKFYSHCAGWQIYKNQNEYYILEPCIDKMKIILSAYIEDDLAQYQGNSGPSQSTSSVDSSKSS